MSELLLHKEVFLISKQQCPLPNAPLLTHEQRIKYLESLDCETITPKAAAAVLGGSPYTLNVMAKNGKLPLRHMWRGRNLRIFRVSLIRLLKGDIP